MNNDIKDKWHLLVSNDELGITAEWIYILLHPTNRDKFFEIVNVIITRHMPKDDENGYTISDEQSTWTSAYRSTFKLTAVEYLIEFEKENEKNNQVYIPTTNPITYPYSPTNIPDCPYVPTNPYPWQSPVIYCGTQPNTFYCTTTSTH